MWSAWSDRLKVGGPRSINEMIWAGRIVPCNSIRSLITASVIEPGQHAAVDLAGLDVLAPARVDRERRVSEDLLHQGRLRHQQDLADRRVVGERVFAGRAIDRGGLEQLPAIEDR